MNKAMLPENTRRKISEAVRYYAPLQDEFETLAGNLHTTLTENRALKPFIHSSRVRAKDPSHLRDKLYRKAVEAFEKKEPFTVNKGNLLASVDDLGGVRLLHLHTDQLRDIHFILLEVLRENRYIFVTKPFAFIWDIENKAFYKDIGIRTIERPSMYTSVHYIVRVNRRTEMRCEIQVRTLAEELWAETSHKINYPHETQSVACVEQLKVLARVASGCTRLVDSVFASHKEFKTRRKRS